MSQENVEVVGRLFDGWAGFHNALVHGADVSGHPWLALWHPECVLEEMSAIPDAAAYRGRAGITRYFQQLGDAFDDIGYTPLEIIAGADGVLVAARCRVARRQAWTFRCACFRRFGSRAG